MLFSSLALHVAAAASHGDAVGGRRGREERAEHLCAPGAVRVQPGCCPWWRGTVCTWNIEIEYEQDGCLIGLAGFDVVAHGIE
jgi:hypothetical protein